MRREARKLPLPFAEVDCKISEETGETGAARRNPERAKEAEGRLARYFGLRGGCVAVVLMKARAGALRAGRASGSSLLCRHVAPLDYLDTV
ncbi:hypothetical protein K0M31_001490 [Melipona bicolor]|uniref:Uncharacterized protein n=1 Tax=Melipona bicolor TaxID=60889 RepID=A0AA40GFQ2_9HYME|nr:hypothetical protein K0M31_001490 [Melipona bicolor]